MQSEKKIIKVKPNWFDRLREKKGIPTGSSPDLGTFLLSEANSNPPIPHFPENTQNLPLRRRPRKQAHPTKRVLGSHHASTSSSPTDAAPVAPVAPAAAVAPVAAVAPAAPVAPADPADLQEGEAPIPVVENPPRFRVNIIQPPFHPMEEDEEEEEEDEEEEEEEEESNITDEANSARMDYLNQFDEESSEPSVGDDDSSDNSGASVIFG
ncbi:unnamed protein product [Lupinus luteus]|uniref:Uncharacterized protein n=1 Tax=Lupinus luteus TaxID=3873 RepID=A0AAV1XE32_LUPLU